MATASVEIDWNGEAKSVLQMNGGWVIVRPAIDGSFAVIAVNGSKRRIVKLLPTLDRARAYAHAMTR